MPVLLGLACPQHVEVRPVQDKDRVGCWFGHSNPPRGASAWGGGKVTKRVRGSLEGPPSWLQMPHPGCKNLCASYGNCLLTSPKHGCRAARGAGSPERPKAPADFSAGVGADGTVCRPAFPSMTYTMSLVCGRTITYWPGIGQRS